MTEAEEARWWEKFTSPSVSPEARALGKEQELKVKERELKKKERELKEKDALTDVPTGQLPPASNPPANK